MKEMKVSYLITDDQYERLEAITEAYKIKGLNTTPERMFEGVMLMGCERSIDDRLKYHEECLEEIWKE